jgi:hypothetical protein
VFDGVLHSGGKWRSRPVDYGLAVPAHDVLIRHKDYEHVVHFVLLAYRWIDAFEVYGVVLCANEAIQGAIKVVKIEQFMPDLVPVVTPSALAFRHPAADRHTESSSRSSQTRLVGR